VTRSDRRLRAEAEILMALGLHLIPIGIKKKPTARWGYTVHRPFQARWVERWLGGCLRQPHGLHLLPGH
jgi:hypothetical protein